MLSMSRLRPDPFSRVHFFASQRMSLETNDEPSVATLLVSTLELGDMAALVVDVSTGATIASNRQAIALLGKMQGYRELAKVLQASPPDTQHTFVWRNAEEQPLVVHQSPVAGSEGVLLLVMLTMLRRDETLAFAEFVRHHGVTAAEERLLTGLVAGDTLADIAARFDLSMPTIKSQLHSLFVRTGTDRQASLVAYYFSDSW
jgi:DNA-binding CsgD family transcriptional regulator